MTAEELYRAAADAVAADHPLLALVYSLEAAQQLVAGVAPAIGVVAPVRHLPMRRERPRTDRLIADLKTTASAVAPAEAETTPTNP